MCRPRGGHTGPPLQPGVGADPRVGPSAEDVQEIRKAVIQAKTAEIMDVNDAAVADAFRRKSCKDLMGAIKNGGDDCIPEPSCHKQEV